VPHPAIGQATAERLAKAGYKVYGTSRRDSPAGRQSFEMPGPRCDPATNRSKPPSRSLMQLEGTIDLLVNNAGFGVAPAGAEESSLETGPRRIFATNFFRHRQDDASRRARICAAKASGARIINIGSVLGFPAHALHGAVFLYQARGRRLLGIARPRTAYAGHSCLRRLNPAYINTAFDANLMKPDAPPRCVPRDSCGAVERTGEGGPRWCRRPRGWWPRSC